jgi:hypothetical protein
LGLLLPRAEHIVDRGDATVHRGGYQDALVRAAVNRGRLQAVVVQQNRSAWDASGGVRQGASADAILEVRHLRAAAVEKLADQELAVRAPDDSQSAVRGAER